MLQFRIFIHFCLPLGTVKPCFEAEKVTRADPRIVRFSFSNKILNFWANIVIQFFYILSEKSGQQSTLFQLFSKHFCIHYLYVVKDRKQLSYCIFPLLHAIPCRRFVFHVVCLLGLKIFGGQNENPCREP